MTGGVFRDDVIGYAQGRAGVLLVIAVLIVLFAIGPRIRRRRVRAFIRALAQRGPTPAAVVEDTDTDRRCPTCR